MEIANLPVSEELKERWLKELESRQIYASFGWSKFGNGKVYLYITYPFKGNLKVGKELLRDGWEESMSRFSGVCRQFDGSSIKGMLTQYRIQVDPKSWKAD